MENEMLITFRSITYAQRGERMLTDFGIRNYLHRTPRFLSERGCGYCLRLRPGNIVQAVDLLREKQIPYGKVFAQGPGGEWEEREL